MNLGDYCQYQARRTGAETCSIPTLPAPPANDPLATTIRAALDGQRLGVVVEESELQPEQLAQFRPQLRAVGP